MTGNCWIPMTQNAYIYALDGPVTLTDPTGLWVRGVGIEYNIGAGCSKGYARFWCEDDEGNYGVIKVEFDTWTLGATATIDSLVLTSDADTIYDMAGRSTVVEVGGGQGLVGASAGVAVKRDRQGRKVTTYYGGISIGPGSPGNASVGESYTSIEWVGRRTPQGRWAQYATPDD